MMKKDIYRLEIIILFYFFIVSNSFGQETKEKNNWNIKAAYSQIVIHPDLSLLDNNALFTLNINYNFNNILELGGYLGFGRITYIPSKKDFTHLKTKNTPFYGINSNLHILPLFVKDIDCWFDPYITGKIGGLYRTMDDVYLRESGHETEYNIGVGVSFYIWKDLGIYTEFDYGKFTFDLSTRIYAGIIYRL